MMSAVHYLHQRNIVHCDIKLENIVFESADINSPLKLIDFGLAKRCDPNTFLVEVAGTPYYMAPEVQRKHYDHRSDIWSLGVIAYILMSGRPPINGRNSDEILARIRDPNLSIDFSRNVFPNASPEAVDFLQRLLTRSPNHRMTLEQAFQHPFIVPAQDAQIAARNVAPSPAIVQSLTRFMRLSNYKKFMLKVIAFSLNRQEIAQLRDAFNAIDRDHSGTISIKELQEYITKLSPDCTADASRQLRLAAENYDSDATLDYNEFLAAAMCNRISIKEEEMARAFRSLDTGNKGIVAVVVFVFRFVSSMVLICRGNYDHLTYTCHDLYCILHRLPRPRHHPPPLYDRHDCTGS
jgi:calcium-dependent protein kinase